MRDLREKELEETDEFEEMKKEIFSLDFDTGIGLTDIDEIVDKYEPKLKAQILKENQISLCPNCNCMTKKVCGKCYEDKILKENPLVGLSDAELAYLLELRQHIVISVFEKFEKELSRRKGKEE